MVGDDVSMPLVSNPITRRAARLGVAAQNALEVARFGGLTTEDEPSPYEVATEQRVYRLRRYYADQGEGPPVVLVPPMMLAAEVYDVSPATSAVTILRQNDVDPWVVDFGKESFAVPIQLGAIETLDLPGARFDVVVLMDVLEHVSDPSMVISRCAALLKRNGFLLIQTPCFDESSSLAALIKSKSPFLKMMIPDEHIYLFGRQSLTMLLESAGLAHVSFEPAVFPYDMILVAGREPRRINARSNIETALLANTSPSTATALKAWLATIIQRRIAGSDRPDRVHRSETSP